MKVNCNPKYQYPKHGLLYLNYPIRIQIVLQSSTKTHSKWHFEQTKTEKESRALATCKRTNQTTIAEKTVGQGATKC